MARLFGSSVNKHSFLGSRALSDSQLHLFQAVASEQEMLQTGKKYTQIAVAFHYNMSVITCIV
jgi:hypothetical protein